MATDRTSLQRDKFNPLLIFSLALLIGIATALAVVVIDNPLVLLGAAVVLVGGILIFFKPEIGLLLVLFMTYTRMPNVAPIVRDLPNLSMVLSVALALLLIIRYVLFYERIDGWQRPIAFFGAYFLIGLASILWAKEPLNVSLGLLEYSKDVLLVAVVVILIRRIETLRRVTWVLVLAGLFLGTISVLQTLTSNYSFDYWGFGKVREMNIVGETSGIRIVGPDMDPNTYGLYLVLLIPLAMDRLWVERNIFLRLLALIAFAVITMAVIFTFSRGAFVTLVVAIALFLMKHPPKPILIVLALCLIPVLWFYVPSKYLERISTLTYLIPGIRDGSGDETVAGVEVATATRDISFKGRLSENIVGLQMSLDHPILGVGLDNFKSYYLDYSSALGLDPRRVGRGAHNLYLEFWAELGIVGLVWFLALNYVSFKGLIRARLDLIWARMFEHASLPSAYMISLISLLFGSIFRHLTYATYMWLFFGIILVIPSVVKRELEHTRG